jgi:ABC-type multidrug transport system fused ATPase/permease subunit
LLFLSKLSKNKNNMAEEKHTLEKKVDWKYNFSEYYGFLKNYKFAMIFLLILGILNGCKQILDKYLFKIIIDKGTQFSSGLILVDVFLKSALIVGGVYIAVVMINLCVNWLQIHFLNILDAGMIIDLKQKYFAHILNLDQNFHTTHKTGSLISRLGRGASAIERMNDILVFDMSPLIFQTIAGVIAVSYLNLSSAMILLGTMIAFIGFGIYMQRISEKSNIVMNKTEDIEKGNMADFFTNVDSVRYFGKEAFIRNRYVNLTNKTKKSQLKNWSYWRTTSTLQSFILAIGTFLLFYFSIRNFLAGEITIGTLAFIYTVYIGLIGPMFGFVHGGRGLSRSMADFQELFEYGKVKSSIQDIPNAKNLEIKKGEVEFKNIDFAYNDKRAIFKNFSLFVPKNKKIALVGHSGCGKSTLVKLLYRLYDVQNGEVLIDGQNIKDIKQNSLRSEMSIVPQECILFDDTIYNNILFSNPKASRKQVLDAIKFSQLDKLIKNLPKKEDTIVGERGVKLSGGEKQRVNIARAILADKRILVLDEATSSLDSETEFEIQKDLAKLMKGRTSIIIAHRLSTIMNADIIVVMKNGKIMQMGSHRDLITEGGEYQRLWDFQKGGYVTESFEHEEKDEDNEED